MIQLTPLKDTGHRAFDLPDEVKYSICKIFAADCKIYGLAENLHLNKLQLKTRKMLQEMATAIQCRNPEHYVLNGHVLEKSEQEKDPGVIIDSSLKFHAHTAAAVKKANQVLGLIKKII